MERIFWSVPLSLAVSTISCVLIGKFLSLSAAVAFLLASGALWLGVLGREWLQLHNSGKKWTIGWRPLGGTALMLAILWIAVALLLLVDFQSGQHLFMSLTIFDHGMRVNWTEAILRTGVPPVNPLYLYHHAATMRYYYFWYVVCAAIVQMAHLPARAVFISSCVWAGFALTALTGLYLKHFLAAGARLRQQFLRAIALFMVTGLGICVNLWSIFYLHRAGSVYLEVWRLGQITSWLDSLLWVPHHIAGMVCCMLAFLLAWMAGKEDAHNRIATIALIAVALASAFGLSIYVAFGFFLVMLAWGFWQVAIQRTPRPALLLAAGGAGAAVLLVPYLWELTHTASGMSSGSVFQFAVRETVPPDGLLASHLFQQLSSGYPLVALNLAKLLLLVPGYAVELGFYLAVLLIYLIPAWRGRTTLTPAQRSLVFIAVTTIVLISVVRSGVLNINDFGWRAALLVQFPLLLLASEVITGWSIADRKGTAPADLAGLPHNTPRWLRSITALALVLGAFTSLGQALLMRFTLAGASEHTSAVYKPEAASIPHKAYISSIGYAQLDAAVPRDAIVQYNPASPNPFWNAMDWLGVDHQSVIVGDESSCGAEFGGDPSGCPAMAAAIDAVYNGATADQARATCRQYGIHYLVARIYDPAWNDRNGWVWTLRPVVSDEEFRALDCRP